MTALTYAESARGYANMWTKAKLRPERRAAAQSVARRLSGNRVRYEKVKVGKTPWFWMAIAHNLEASGNFTRHLHNGDPLTARTTHVPAGRPLKGQPPFAWEDSAVDALTMHRLDEVADWPVERCLFEWERYNGFGYVARKVNSPYVWSFTDQYARGKYVADGKFDAAAVSQQCGAAATLQAMLELHLVTLPAPAIPDAIKPAIQLDKPIPPIVVSPVKARTPQWDIVGWLVSTIKRMFA